MGDGMRALKFAVIAMGVLILLGTAILVGTVIKRSTSGSGVAADRPLPERPMPDGPTTDKAFAAVLDEPTGTAIVGMAAVQGRLAVQLRGGGAERVLLIDTANGAVVGRLSLSR